MLPRVEDRKVRQRTTSQTSQVGGGNSGGGVPQPFLQLGSARATQVMQWDLGQKLGRV